MKNSDEIFDLIFIDADKENYAEYLKLVKPRMKSGGVLMVDNVLWYGKVLDEKGNKQTEQIKLVNKLIAEDADFENVIIYIWKTGDDIEWLLDKKLKSNLIIVNSDCDDQITVGYMIAQANSCYFGTLKNFSKANANAIYDVDQITNILERKIR